MKRILQVLCAYIIFVAAAVMTVSFLYRNVPELIDGQELAYRLNRGLLWLMAYLPAAMLSGFLVGTSIAFGKDSENSKRKYSAGMFERYKTVMIIALCMVLVLTVCAEIITPLLQTRREKFENAPQDLRDYIVLSKDCIASGRITLAYQYASMAYSIAPNDSEVARLYENASDSLRIAKASAPSPVPPAYTEAERLTDTKIDGNNTEYTVHLLLARADAEFGNGEYFNAHYFASLASDIAQSTDPNGIRAKQLAADAWNELEKARVFENEEVRRFYARKKEGYRALNNKNYLAAYYIFSALSNESLSYAADPDVKRYLAVAAEKVEENYFFIDETQQLDGFETAQNVYFSIPSQTGKKDIVFIKNMYTVQDAGGLVRYLRGLHILTYSAGMKLQRSISVEYAKMIALPTETFAEMPLGLDDSVAHVPYIMLVSVDRDLEGTIAKPEVQYYTPEAENLYSFSNKTSYILTMPYDDISAVMSAAAGPERMYLPDLFKFVPKTANYGFSFEAFNQAFIRRVVYPLFLLLIILFTAVLSWNYRIGQDKLFRFVWIFGMPFFSFFIYIMMNCLTYIFSLLNCAFTGMFGSMAMPVAFIIYAALLVADSILFLSRKADGA